MVSSCSEKKELKVSGDSYQPIKIKLKTDQGFEPIRVTQSGGGIDFSYKTTYTAPSKQEFRVLMANGKLDKFIGFGFKADFHHYAKLLTVEYKSLDSINLIKNYNNPISWTSNDINN